MKIFRNLIKRSIHSSAVTKEICLPLDDSEKEACESFKKLKIKQQQFQHNDGKPIFLKRPGDKTLFLLTMGLCCLGLFRSFEFILNMAFPLKNQISEPVSDTTVSSE